MAAFEVLQLPDSGKPVGIPSGTAGYVLTSNGAGVAPTFQAPASVDIGSSIPSGTVGRVLFVGSGPALAEDDDFTWVVAGGSRSVLVITPGTGSSDTAGMEARNSAANAAGFGVTSTGWSAGVQGADAGYGFATGALGFAVYAAAGEIRLNAGGVNGLIIESSAYAYAPLRLGVGGSPLAPLHVMGTGATEGRISTTGTGSTEQAAWTAYNSASNLCTFGVTSTGWTTAYGADAGYGLINASAGLALNAISGELRLAYGGTARVVVDSTGIGLFGATPVAQLTSGANLTNNVTSGGTNDQIDDFTDLTIYANDASAIRNAIYQLARKVKQLNDGLRSRGDFT